MHIRNASRSLSLALALACLPFGFALPATALQRPADLRLRDRAPFVLIVMENKGYDAIVGSAEAPYLNQTLIPAGTLFTNSHAITRPSLPNYLALTAGSTLGCETSDCALGTHAKNLFGQLSRAGVRWATWASSMPEPCARYDADPYAMRHNPAVLYANIHPWPCRARVVRYPHTFPNRLPSFVFVVPNLCQDMHDCPVSAGDRWLSRQVPRFQALGATVLITFDETLDDASTRIATVMVGPGVAAGVTDGRRLTHYGVLAGIERHFGLARLRHARTARPLQI